MQLIMPLYQSQNFQRPLYIIKARSIQKQPTADLLSQPATGSKTFVFDLT